MKGASEVKIYFKGQEPRHTGNTLRLYGYNQETAQTELDRCKDDEETNRLRLLALQGPGAGHRRRAASGN